MMSWIKVYSSLRNDPRVLEIANRLNISVAQVIGHLVLLWTWAMEWYSSDGFLDMADSSTVARVADWNGDPRVFFNAIHEAGDGVLTNFIDFDGESPFLKLGDWDKIRGGKDGH